MLRPQPCSLPTPTLPWCGPRCRAQFQITQVAPLVSPPLSMDPGGGVGLLGQLLSTAEGRQAPPVTQCSHQDDRTKEPWGTCPLWQQGRALPCPPPSPPQMLPDPTYDVVHQVSGAPDDKEADKWGEEGEPRQRGDIRDTLTWRVGHSGCPSTTSQCLRTLPLNLASCVPPANHLGPGPATSPTNLGTTTPLVFLPAQNFSLVNSFSFYAQFLRHLLQEALPTLSLFLPQNLGCTVPSL